MIRKANKNAPSTAMDAAQKQNNFESIVPQNERVALNEN